MPLDEDSGEADDLYQIHECCGQQCEQLKEGVSEFDTREADKRMPNYPSNSWSLNDHAFNDLDGKTGGLLRGLVGEYESNQLRRLWLRRDIIGKLRAIAESMEGGHYKSFLNILCDCAESALETHNKLAAISNS